MKWTVIHDRTAGLVMAAGVLMAAGAQGQGPAEGRYGIIIERKPFGAEMVPVVEPPPPAVPPEKSVVNQIRMSAVVRDNRGVLRVGLEDLKTKRNYMLGMGESVDGIEVVSADYMAERARLRRGEEDYWVSMQGGSNRFERVMPSTAAALPRDRGMDSGKPEEPLPEGLDQRRSYLLRRQQREEARLRRELDRLSALEAERAKAAALTSTTDVAVAAGSVKRAAKKKAGDTSERALLSALTQTENIELSDEEISRLLQEYQKELIRKGLPPLNIPLTAETDRQLVEEGYLPAME